MFSKAISAVLLETVIATIPLNIYAQDELAQIKAQMASTMQISDEYIAKAVKLEFKPIANGVEIDQAKCEEIEAQLNVHLQNYTHKKLQLGGTDVSKSVRGVDFCYENAINSMRQDAFVSINPRKIFLNVGEFKSATGMPVTRVLTLSYHVGGLEQYLINSKNEVVQFNYQRKIWRSQNSFNRVVTAVTPDNNLISRQAHVATPSGELESLELAFVAADGKSNASAEVFSMSNTKLETNRYGLFEIGDLKPAITVLSATIAGDDGGVRFDGGLWEGETRYYDSNNKIASLPGSRLFTVQHREKRSCESASVWHNSKWTEFGDNHCYDDLIKKQPMDREG